MKKITNLISISKGVELDDYSFAMGKVKIETTPQHNHSLTMSRKVEKAGFLTP